MAFARTKIQPPAPARELRRARPAARAARRRAANRRVVLSARPPATARRCCSHRRSRGCRRARRSPGSPPTPGDDAQRLIECMLAALEPFDPPWRTAPESLLARVGRSADEQRAVAADIINALDSCEATHGVIVFDDLHRVADPAFFRFLDLLIERMSPRWTLALTSRTDPPLVARATSRRRRARRVPPAPAPVRARRRTPHGGAGRHRRRARRPAVRPHPGLAGRIAHRDRRRARGCRRRGVAGGDRARAARRRPAALRLPADRSAGRPDRRARDFLLAGRACSTELDAKRCAEVSGNANAAALLDAIERLGLFVEVLDAPVRDAAPARPAARRAPAAPGARAARASASELRARAADTEPDPVRRIALRLDAEDYDAGGARRVRARPADRRDQRHVNRAQPHRALPSGVPRAFARACAGAGPGRLGPLGLQGDARGVRARRAGFLAGGDEARRVVRARVPRDRIDRARPARRRGGRARLDASARRCRARRAS